MLVYLKVEYSKEMMEIKDFLEKKHVCIFILHLIYHVVDFKKKKKEKW